MATPCSSTAPTPPTTPGTAPACGPSKSSPSAPPCGSAASPKRRCAGAPKTWGLFTWNKPAYACLATRVPTGEPITPQVLEKVEHAEDALFALGFSDLRVRVFHGAARLQFPAAQLARAAQEREAIRLALSPWFTAVLLDLDPR